MKRKNRLIFFFIPFLLFPSCCFASSEQTSNTKLKTDVILIGTPIKVRPILAGGTVDVLEKPPQEMGPVWEVVVFGIEKILMGDFERIMVEEPPLKDQMKQAVAEKEFLKILTMDFKKTDEEGFPKNYLSVAVSDPFASFGAKLGEEPPRDRYKLYLALVHKNPNSYVLVKSEKLGPAPK